MTKRFLYSVMILACAWTGAAQPAPPPPADQPAAIGDQEQPPPPPPAPPPGAPSRRVTPAPEPPMPPVAQPMRRGQLANVKVEVTITDQVAAKQPVIKTLSLIVADSRRGMIRTDAEAPRLAGGEGPTQNVPLHVDAQPTIEEGKIRLELGLSYIVIGRIEPVVELPAEEKARLARGQQLAKTDIRENLVIVLENGKPMVVAQSADPLTDRRVTVEVKATILK